MSTEIFLQWQLFIISGASRLVERFPVSKNPANLANHQYRCFLWHSMPIGTYPSYLSMGFNLIKRFETPFSSVRSRSKALRGGGVSFGRFHLRSSPFCLKKCLIFTCPLKIESSLKFVGFLVISASAPQNFSTNFLSLWPLLSSFCRSIVTFSFLINVRPKIHGIRQSVSERFCFREFLCKYVFFFTS